MGEPGLTLVAPATLADAKGLLKSAIRDDNPVVVFENKLLYGRKGEVADGDDALVPLGRAAVRRSGSDVTIVGALRAVEIALDAAETLAAEGVGADVIDLRTLRPLDATTLPSPSRAPVGSSWWRRGLRPTATRPTSSPRRCSSPAPSRHDE